MLSQKNIRVTSRRLFFVVFSFVWTFSCGSACTYHFRVDVAQEDASVLVNGQNVANHAVFASADDSVNVDVSHRGYFSETGKISQMIPFGVSGLDVSLVPNSCELEIGTVQDVESLVYIDSRLCGRTGEKLTLEYGTYDLLLVNAMFPIRKFVLDARSDGKRLYRFQEITKLAHTEMKQIGIFPCGKQPKQVLFSPDDRFVFMPLLSGTGFDVFDTQTLKVERSIEPPGTSRAQGFAEGLFIDEKKVFMVSQMSTGKIYEYTLPDLELVRSVGTGGVGPKFMAWSSALGVVAVSNWFSNNVSVIDYASGRIVANIDTPRSPRGLAFTSDTRYLYVTTFDGGTIHKISTATWKDAVVPIHIEQSCMRHIVLSSDEKLAYVSDMNYCRVYTLDTNSFEIVDTYRVDSNPNTIALTPDGKRLFVSCRGPNDSETYLNRSPRNGRIAIIDLVHKKVEAFIEGGNQPTGLAISNDGAMLCFSNFRDNNIELYSIGNEDE
jgi:YVTN family beta-propeller protein